MATGAEIHVFATFASQPAKADDVRAALVELVGEARTEPLRAGD